MAESRSYRTEALVLRTYKLGEADRIAVLLTPDAGKVRGVAKGVRKTRSRLGNRLEPTSYVNAQLYKGRSDLQTITQTETIETFTTLREDLDRLTAAASILEAADHMSLEGEANPAMFQMVVGALRTVNRDHPELTVAGFFWKLLALEGFSPMLDECISCGSKTELDTFDIDDGGVRCAGCRRGRPISEQAITIIKMMLGGQLGAALSLPSAPATQEVNALAAAALEHHVERRLRSLTVLRE